MVLRQSRIPLSSISYFNSNFKVFSSQTESDPTTAISENIMNNVSGDGYLLTNIIIVLYNMNVLYCIVL